MASGLTLRSDRPTAHSDSLPQVRRIRSEPTRLVNRVSDESQHPIRPEA